MRRASHNRVVVVQAGLMPSGTAPLTTKRVSMVDQDRTRCLGCG
jgi:hypothetical protein